ncbi:hypothetical protein BZA70DRAFT_267627 [Myxozyma melibiosi]|uniref:PiggyBac transposable element-derived protein domain-containing protein n=1 Tax=Myxozyma melibiosi TaxID=54550 RepID=A0ABR1F5I5_9ASCO
MRLDNSRTTQSDLDAAAASLAAMSFVELHESDYSDIDARRDPTADLSSDSQPDSESEDDIITSEQFESALDSDSDSDLASQPDSDSGSSSASDDIPMAYNPEALHESFKSLTLINQIRHSRKFKMKLDRSQAAILYAFALFFCLNGPVGFNTEVYLRFSVDLPDSTINVRGMYSIRQVFGRKLTHLMFSEYVVAVKRALPQNIS